MNESVVVVTGGGRGIGRAICERFAVAGSRVIGAARTAAELEETRMIIEQGGGHYCGEVVDVCLATDIESLIQGAVSKFGRVDVLVNNAGFGALAKIEELSPLLFEATMAVNVEAVYHGCRTVWPVMRKQGGGVIVNISSVASVDPFPGFAAYGAAKAWVNAWTNGLADEGRPYGIRVMGIAPGAVETRMLRDAFPDFPADQTLQPADVAEIVFTTCQPSCHHASGQVIFVRK